MYIIIILTYHIKVVGGGIIMCMFVIVCDFQQKVLSSFKKIFIIGYESFYDREVENFFYSGKYNTRLSTCFASLMQFIST